MSKGNKLSYKLCYLQLNSQNSEKVNNTNTTNHLIMAGVCLDYVLDGNSRTKKKIIYIYMFEVASDKTAQCEATRTCIRQHFV